MKHRIRRIDPLQAAKMAAVLYAIMGLLLAPIFVLAAKAAPNAPGFGVGLAIAMPIFYGAIGFIFTAIGAALYNVVAGWIGGIEMDLDATPSA